MKIIDGAVLFAEAYIVIDQLRVGWEKGELGLHNKSLSEDKNTTFSFRLTSLQIIINQYWGQEF